MNKTDFFTMIYQFIFAGVVWFIAVSDNTTTFLTGKVIYLPKSFGIDMGFSLGLLLTFFLLPLTIFSLGIQRKIYVNQQIKKEIEKYKSREDLEKRK